MMTIVNMNQNYKKQYPKIMVRHFLTILYYLEGNGIPYLPGMEYLNWQTTLKASYGLQNIVPAFFTKKNTKFFSQSAQSSPVFFVVKTKQP